MDKKEVEQFEDWWTREGRFLDPDTEDVPWFDKRKGLAAMAYEVALKAQGYKLSSCEKERDAALARLDAVMFEYCAGDMTPTQIERWAKAQRSVEEPPTK